MSNCSNKKLVQGEMVPSEPMFPSTRYWGSKAKLAKQIAERLEHLEFNSVLDIFSGTCAMAYEFKKMGKSVRCNDYLRSNYLTARALIVNREFTLTNDDIDWLLSRHADLHYSDFIENTFEGVYFTTEENQWLDMAVTNILNFQRLCSNRRETRYKQAIAWHALFQSCTAKRPFGLYHRKNLYMRLANVERNFGNKSTWDTSFDEHYRRHAEEANAAVFDNGDVNMATCQDVFSVPSGLNHELVYIDAPYMNAKGVGVDYADFYHFLEGMTDYDKWALRIDYNTKHRKLKTVKSCFSDKHLIYLAFDKLFKRHSESILAVSYRADGKPAPEELTELMSKYKDRVYEAARLKYKYSMSNADIEEILLVGV